MVLPVSFLPDLRLYDLASIKPTVQTADAPGHRSQAPGHRWEAPAEPLQGSRELGHPEAEPPCPREERRQRQMVTAWRSKDAWGVQRI